MQGTLLKSAAAGTKACPHAPCTNTTRPCVRASAAAHPRDASRRGLLLGAGASLWLLQKPEARADTCATIELDANARRERGERDLEEEAIAFECRQRDISKQLEARSYDEASARKTGAPVPNVPVANLDSEYAQETLKLADQIEKYLVLDVYDRERVPLIKDMKRNSAAWVAKYARGGSARSQSARKMYIAADAVSGFLASNGLAPMPQAKREATQKSLNDARTFLAKGI